MKGAYVKDAGYGRPQWEHLRKDVFTILSVPKGYTVREISKDSQVFGHRTVQIRLKKVV